MSDPSTQPGFHPVPGYIKRAIAYMRRNLSHAITIRDLANASGASESTLRKNFVRFVGHPPLVHLRCLRLTAARDRLLRSPGQPVSDVALQYGFTHFGRFSSDYMRLFGELPSQTRSKGRLAATDGTDSKPPRVGGIVAPCVWRLAPTLRIARFRISAPERDARDFADDLTERLAATLCRAQSLVVKLSSAAPNGGADTRDDARYLLTGKITADGNLHRVIVRLVEVESDIHLWGDTFDGPLNGAGQLQERIVAAVMNATHPSILRREINRAQATCVDAPSARNLVLRALPLALSGDRYLQAIDLLHQAMALDPDYALPSALAAWCYARSANPWSDRSAEHKSTAIRLAARAGALDDGDALVLTALASVQTMAGAYDSADAMLTRALAIDPACSWAYERRGWLRIFSRSFDEAITDFNRALGCKGPIGDGASSLFGIGTTHWCAGRIAEAAPWLRRAVIERPSAPGMQAQLAGCYLRLGERGAAHRSLNEVRRDVPDATVTQLLRSFWFDKPCPTVANDLVEIGMAP
jgi:AraC-like DNA-binding protein/TolB-like protein/tetratricopeptide (TPR) repeat protein